MSNKVYYNNVNYFEEVSEQIKLLKNEINAINKLTQLIFDCDLRGNKVLVAGNGGSNSDAEHFVGELVCTFLDRDRDPISAINLSSNTAAITAWSNDFSYETYMLRQVKAYGKKGDVLILLSTSGGSYKNNTSINLLKACEEANNLGINTFSLIGRDGGELKKISKNAIIIKSNSTSIIQECHMSILHAICNNLEVMMKKNKDC